MLKLRKPTLSEWTLFTALIISTVAAYYSIMGLVAIFAAAVIPIIIMGTVLEIGKITTSVWLRKYWHRCTWQLKAYLIPAVLLLALLTSMGIFGFLSKAHTDQSLVSGDVTAKIAIYDEKIKISRDNIDANRKALKQMDEAVDQVMGRSTDEKGADKAVSIRRSQGGERTRLLKEIEAEQKKITAINDERAPIAAEVRKVEAEVGPIKYIAAFIYGDNPDANILERAVRWMIILIVIVFDPLAIILVLAANSSIQWDREDEEGDEPAKKKRTGFMPIDPKDIEAINEIAIDDFYPPKSELKVDVDAINRQLQDAAEPPQEPECHNESELVEQKDEDDYIDYSVEYGRRATSAPHYQHIEDADDEEPAYEADDGPLTDEQIRQIQLTADSERPTGELIAREELFSEPKPDPKVEGVTRELINPDSDYILYEGKNMSREALRGMNPSALNEGIAHRATHEGFGYDFPEQAIRGDTQVRVDYLPHRLYKFIGSKWIQVDRNNSGSYAHNPQYLEYLVQKIDSGEYDPDYLTDYERDQIEEYLVKRK